MQRVLEPNGDEQIGLWTAWLIRTLEREVRPDFTGSLYRPAPSAAERQERCRSFD